MSSRKLLALGLATVVRGRRLRRVPAPTPSPASQAPAPTTAPASTAPESAAPSESAAAASPSAEALAPDPAEAVIPSVEPNAEIGFWTFYLSPTFDQYIKDTIARFEATYPGVKVNWEDHQATFKDDLNNAFNAGNAPDVINLSVCRRAGSASTPARASCCRWTTRSPRRQGHLLRGPLEGAAHRRRQLPVPVVPGPQRRADQQGHHGQGRRRVDDFPKTIDGLPALCKTIFDKTGRRCATSASRSTTCSPRWSTRATSRS